MEWISQNIVMKRRSAANRICMDFQSLEYVALKIESRTLPVIVDLVAQLSHICIEHFRN